MRGEIGSTFKIDGGDGDQDFFPSPMIARRVSEPWFGGTLPRGQAYLLQLANGKHIGEYVAVTSRQVASLSDQLANGPWASVVVHRILQPGEGFSPTVEAAPAIGMAIIEAL
ncbi:MAG TPA: hypothetical protein VK533_14740 [Sphingomonas sp.]|uniref:hypothetical protein n=1 Tax=Sphingomonas sp. TaxID=28214 RepID=UPI002C676661|nr:hypothetical protein [Sphingomonas sp.]HMI20791.1 hypothetical protein [Sphingomonas sp.]